MQQRVTKFGKYSAICTSSEATPIAHFSTSFCSVLDGVQKHRSITSCSSAETWSSDCSGARSNVHQSSGMPQCFMSDENLAWILHAFHPRLPLRMHLLHPHFTSDTDFATGWLVFAVALTDHHFWKVSLTFQRLQQTRNLLVLWHISCRKVHQTLDMLAGGIPSLDCSHNHSLLNPADDSKETMR